MNLETLTEQEAQYLENTQPELEYQISLIDDELAQIYVQNHKPNNFARKKTGLLLVECIERKIMEEAAYKANQKMEDMS